MRRIGLLLVSFLFVLSCEKESVDKFLTEPPEMFISLVEQGWDSFSQGEYDSAIVYFSVAAERDATIPGVYVGLGWSYARNQALEKATSNFQKAVAFAFLDPENETTISSESFAGLAVVSLANGEYTAAVDYCDYTLNLDLEFIFSKDVSFSAHDLKVIKAECYYYLGMVEECYLQVKALGGTIDNVIDTTAVATVSLTDNSDALGIFNVSVNEDHKLVTVSEVKSYTNMTYDILDVSEGNNELTIQGNPALSEGEEVVATYIFTLDFPLFLNKLITEIQDFQ